MWYVALVMLCSVLTLAGIVSVWVVTRRSSSSPSGRGTSKTPQVGVSILKPLCGKDDALESNLLTFFRQAYPNFELVFGVEGNDDPALEVVTSLRRRFPEIPCRVVVHDGGRGINPKVSNLRAMMEAVRNDVIVISDSNIAAPADYLCEMVGVLERPNVGLVTNPVSGTSERTFGALLGNLHLNGPIAGSVAGSYCLSRRTIALGKSMMFRRSIFAKLGGFEAVANVLAEDYVIGRMFLAAGFQVRLAPVVVENVCESSTIRAFLHRNLRWGVMRWRLKPLMYPFEPLANPVAVALLAPVFGADLLWALLWAFSLTLLRDAAQWIRLRGSGGLLRAVPFGLLKETAMVAVWLVAPFHRHISWRGTRVRLSAGTRLYASRPMLGPNAVTIWD